MANATLPEMINLLPVIFPNVFFVTLPYIGSIILNYKNNEEMDAIKEKIENLSSKQQDIIKEKLENILYVERLRLSEECSSEVYTIDFF